MRKAACFVCILFVFTIGSASAQPTRNAQIEVVIQQQLDAFSADDFKTAFSFATPSIQERFGSAERFGLMVVHAYPMVWRATDVQYISLEEYPTYALQKVMVTDRDKALHILLYQMLPVDNEWRIGGVRILKMPGSTT
jgi:hypothetical protein